MAGGVKETDPINLARHCESFKTGAKVLFDERGDMWFFELFHHLDDCAEALRATTSLNLADGTET